MRNIGKMKVESTIILSAIILALIVLALFWGLNREKPTTSTLSNTTQAALYESPAPEATTAPIEPEKNTVSATPLGLAKIKTGSTTVKALIIGDSVAESVGASNKEVSSWYTLVANDLQTKYSGTFQWNFKTQKKATIDDALKTLPEVTPDTDLVILCLGRNDWSTLTTDEFRQKYEQLLGELKVKVPDASIFLVVEPPVTKIATNNESFPYRQVILELSQKYPLPVIDQWSAFINNPAPLSGLLADGVNPNDQGYRVFADEVLVKFNEFLLVK